MVEHANHGVCDITHKCPRRDAQRRARQSWCPSRHPHIVKQVVNFPLAGLDVQKGLGFVFVLFDRYARPIHQT